MGSNSFRLNIREVGRGSAFPKFPLLTSKRVEVYQGNLRDHIYIKDFRTTNDREPRDEESKRYLESQTCYRTHYHIFY